MSKAATQPRWPRLHRGPLLSRGGWASRWPATLPLVRYVFQSQFRTNYPAAIASYLMALAPMLVVYVFAQRWVISGVTRGAIK